MIEAVLTTIEVGPDEKTPGASLTELKRRVSGDCARDA